ncbi:MAG: Camelysin metallo-endopeptidase [Clostridia bacterium]|jgi:predicted ribosomally synthesized peptide with SipW-like signal peptide|nr:Camelysin metallo-endopeptidase [Clostridia bacterium]
MNKKVIISLVLVALMGFGTAIGTFAWFTSTATSNNNVFTAGTIALDVNGQTDGSFDIALNNSGLVQPGDILTGGDNGIAMITVKNNGNLPMGTFSRFTLANDTGLLDDMKITDYAVEYYGSNGQLKKTISRKTGIDNWFANGVKLNTAVNANNMRQWITGNGPEDIPSTAWDMELLKPQEYYIVKFKLVYDTAAEDQGKTCNIGFEVKSTQFNIDAIKALQLEGVTDSAIESDGGVFDYFQYQDTEPLYVEPGV